MRRRSRQPEAPERVPHPEPRTEIQLQQIISLRRAAARNEELLDRYRADIATMNAVISQHPTWSGHAQRYKQIAFLTRETDRLNAENRALHDQIAELSAKLDDIDLAYLEARR